MTQSAQALRSTSTSKASVSGTSVNKQIFRALLRLASAALLIRVMGMLNQIIVTDRFGAGARMDAYFVASSLPLLLAQLIISAIEFSVIPVYAQVCTQGTKEQRSKLFSTLLNLVTVGTALLTLVIYIFRRQVIFLVAPALDPFRAGLTVDLAPFIFPVLLLMVVIGFLESLLNTEGQFGWPAYAGILVPLTTAILVLLVGKSLGVVMLCVGMLVGLCLQLCVFVVRIRRVGLVYRPTLDLTNPEIISILLVAWPALVSALISQVSPLIDQIFASSLSAGSISALSYSLKLISVPVGVIFVSVGRAVLPYLSRQASLNDMQAFKETLRLYLWATAIGTVALSAFMLVLAHPLVQILFQRGAFTAEDTNLTASTLTGFALGLTPMALGFVMAKAFGALGKTQLLMRVTIFMVFSNAVFDYIFARLWQSFGIALATSVVYLCTMFILFPTLRHMIGRLDFFIPPPELLTMIKKIGQGHFYTQSLPWLGKRNASMPVLYHLRHQIIRIATILVVFAAGVAGVFLNALYTLRVAFGSLIVLAFLRYRYALLIAWVLFSAFIGSSLQIFSGNNFLTGLTAPLLLLMLCMPIRQTFKRMPVLPFLLIYLLWVFASIGISAIGVESFLTIWITLLNYVAIAVLTINVVTTRRRMLGLIDAILLVITLIALYGIYGYITRHNGILDPATKVFRIISIFSAAPSLALLLSIVIPLAIYRAFTLQGLKRVGVFIVTLICLVALGLTFTRTTFITVPLSIIIMIFFLPSRKMKVGLLSSIATVTILTVLLGIVGHVPIFSRFFNNDILTLNGRTYLWQALLDHFDPTQLLGNGLNASDLLLASLQVSDSRGTGVIATAPHNIFLGALYDHGIIGVILLTLVFMRLLVSLITEVRKATGEHRMLFVMVLAILVSVLLQSLESRDLWIFKIGMYFWIIMALPFASYWFTTRQQPVTDGVFVDESIQRAERDMNQSSGFGDKRIRVCLISVKFSPRIGGAEILAERQAYQLQALGHQVTILTLRHEKGWKRTEKLNGLPVVRVGGIYRRGGYLRNGRLTHVAADMAMFLALWRLRDQYDLIHTFQASSLAAVAALIGKMTKKPLIIGIQNAGPDEKQRTRIERGAMLMADTLTDTGFLKVDFQDWAPSDSDMAYLPRLGLGGRTMLRFLQKSNAYYHVSSTRSFSYLTAHGFRAEQIVLFPYGVDTEKFRPAPEGRPDPTKPERDIICVARLAYSKGVDVLLHAWGRMMHAPAEWRTDLKPHLRLAGDGVFRPQMERIVSELGIQDSVEFLGERTDIVDLLQQSWGFVLPSRWEGLPGALTEALACGLPCVATRVSGSEDAIRDGINGLLVEPEQPAELAQALQHIIEDSDLAQRLGQEGRATALRDYQLINVIEQFLKLYQILLTHQNSRVGHLQDMLLQHDSPLATKERGTSE